MEITGVDDDDIFYSGSLFPCTSQWNGRSVMQLEEPLTDVQAMLACSRVTDWEGELKVYQEPDGTVGGSLSWHVFFDPPASEETSNDNQDDEDEEIDL